MKEKIYLLIVLALTGMVFGQADPNDPTPTPAEVEVSTPTPAEIVDPVVETEPAGETSSEYASDDNPGYVQKLLDFNLLGHGSRYDEPFHIENWNLSLDNSINFPYNKNLTYLKPVTNKGGNISMGIRINFPKVQMTAVGTLKPVFPVPFSRDKYKEKGFLDNVGIIRSIRLRIRANIFPYRVTLLLQDKQGNITEYRFNERLDFFGWKDIYWENTVYESRYAYKETEKKRPIYPSVVPGVRFHSIKFERERGVGTEISGIDPRGADFITYLSEIAITYDKAVSEDLLLTEEEIASPHYIDNEDVWKIEKEYENSISGDQSRGRGAFATYKYNLLIQRSRKNLGTPIDYSNLFDSIQSTEVESTETGSEEVGSIEEQPTEVEPTQ